MNLNKIFLFTVIILIIVYFSYTMNKESFINYLDYQKWKIGSMANKRYKYHEFADSKLDKFKPTKTSILTTNCNQESKCITY